MLWESDSNVKLAMISPSLFYHQYSQQFLSVIILLLISLRYFPYSGSSFDSPRSP